MVCSTNQGGVSAAESCATGASLQPGSCSRGAQSPGELGKVSAGEDLL